MTESPPQDRKPVAWVAGGSRGLGYALAGELGRAGYHVVISARTQTDLARAANQLRAAGAEVTTRVHDVRDAAGARDLVQEIESRYGSIETVISVAGVITVGPVPDLAEAYDESLDIMLRGPINVVHAVLPGMRERRRGRIGIVTSIAGVIPVPHLLAYSAAKHGAVGFARGLSEELTGSGITVSTIIPGLMRTGGHWQAGYVGRSEQEYAWFTGLSALPIVAMDASRAARIIAAGVAAGRRKIIFTLPARLGDFVYRLSPVGVGTVVGAAGRLLPRPPDDASGDDQTHDDQAPGFRAAAGLPKVFDRFTALARNAVRRFNNQAGFQ
ncbi:SDR family NAD(P)-dependent oxidoreductase [Microlunatus endophyticus]|nr:SDR family NAD(P)-dependent oxidoreductase [Microlunatus endophyticus]